MQLTNARKRWPPSVSNEEPSEEIDRAFGCWALTNFQALVDGLFCFKSVLFQTEANLGYTVTHQALNNTIGDAQVAIQEAVSFCRCCSCAYSRRTQMNSEATLQQLQQQQILVSYEEGQDTREMVKHLKSSLQMVGQEELSVSLVKRMKTKKHRLALHFHPHCRPHHQVD